MTTWNWTIALALGLVAGWLVLILWGGFWTLVAPWPAHEPFGYVVAAPVAFIVFWRAVAGMRGERGRSSRRERPDAGENSGADACAGGGGKKRRRGL